MTHFSSSSIPALIDRIYDYVYLENEQTRCAKDKTFEIIWADTENVNELVGKEAGADSLNMKINQFSSKYVPVNTKTEAQIKH